MIGFIKIHYKNKLKLEEFILNNDSIKIITMTHELRRNNIAYPLDAKYLSIDYTIGEYKGYVKVNLMNFYYDLKQINVYKSFKYNYLTESIEALKEHTVELKDSSLSKLSMVFYLDLRSSEKDIIRNNILMHKLNGYNHDKINGRNNNVKQFQYCNYLIGFYPLQVKTINNVWTLKVELQFLNSSEFKKLGILNLMNLKDKSKLKGLFSIFLKRFDELTIIDDIEDYEVFMEEDKRKFLQYINPNFWHSVSHNSNRQNKLRKKKDFERIQKQYSLNNVKNNLRENIISKFNEFIKY